MSKKLVRKLGKVTFSPEAIWMIPFVKAARPLIPIERIKHIKTYKAPKSKQDESEGLIERNSKGNFTIKVKLYQHRYKIIKDEPLTLEYQEDDLRMLWFMLSGLAHELSHTVNWDHDINHYILENRIMRRFIKILKKKDVKDLYRRGPV
jgi:hypothetical protein